MIVGIDQMEIIAYTLGGDQSEHEADLSQREIEQFDAAFAAFIAAQVRIVDLLKQRPKPPIRALLRWCSECGIETIADPNGYCSTCGFPYPEDEGT